jgi:parallel beta-helix repeat protein
MSLRKTVSSVRSLFGREPAPVTRQRRRLGRQRQVAAGEPLEGRAMLATFAVTSELDAGAGTLRDAIQQANASAGFDTIEFRLSTASTVITLASPLDAITDEVLIDGTTQPGYLEAPIVEVDGGGTIVGAGFRFEMTSGGSTLKGLSIYGMAYDPAYDPYSATPGTGTFSPSGIGVYIDEGTQDIAILDSYIGTNALADAASPVIGNAVAGVLVNKALDTTIVGCVISNNGSTASTTATLQGGAGIVLDGDQGTRITASLIGVDPTGDAALPNVAEGIRAIGSSSLFVGGNQAVDANVISGNGGAGIRMVGVTEALILGNLIGVDATTGAVAVANGGAGIVVDGDGVEIGDGTVGGRNVISGNALEGLRILGGTSTVVQGNYIGTTASGTEGLGNSLEGLRIDGGSGHVIGGTLALQGNVISGNAADGIRIAREASDVLVQRNLVGLGITLANIGNSGDGIAIEEASGVTVTYSNRVAFNTGVGIRLTGATNNLVGADSTRPEGEQGVDYGNVVYGNELQGILLEAGANGNVVAANVVGRTAANGAIVGNLGDGIAVQASASNMIGGLLATATDPAYGNVVAGNVAGIIVSNSDAVTPVSGNVVIGNSVQNNLGHGIVVDDSSNQTIGGIISTTANIVTLNDGNGIEVRNGSRDVLVTGNYIGTNASGVLGLGNGGIGVRVMQSSGTVVGGDSAAEAGNVVVGQASDGIVITRVDDAGITSGTASGNQVLGNVVRANKGSGIRITSASDNTVGAAATGYGNTVTGNMLDGLRIETAADGNTVLGNTFGGAVSQGNGGAGVRVTASNENLIGGAAAGAGNTISRNAGAGVIIDQAVAIDFDNGNVVAGNLIDSNLAQGVLVTGSRFQTIGGAVGDPGTPGNTITNNRGVGIRLTADAVGVNSDENLVRSNFVGTDASGNSLGNLGHGIEVVKGSFNVLESNTVGRNTGYGIRIDGGGAADADGVSVSNTIGGDLVEEGNLVVANRQGGILVENDARGTEILNTQVEANKGVGITLRGGQNSLIGAGTTVVLSAGDGILIGNQTVSGRTFLTSGTRVTGAFIGTDSLDSLDTAALGNQGAGIRLSNANDVTVDVGTVVAANRLSGVRVEASQPITDTVGNIVTPGNTVRGVTIRDNLGHGVIVNASGYQTIGGVIDGYENLVTGNTLDGVMINGSSRLIAVQGNTIAENRRNGISVFSANDVTIDEGNDVSGNLVDGISFYGTSTRGIVQNNFIGQSDAGAANGNGKDGVSLLGVNGIAVSGNVIGSNLRHGVSIINAIAGGPSLANGLFDNAIVDNAQNGVTVLGSRNQVIGSSSSLSPGNTIGGNGLDGIYVGTGSSAITVVGNLIGTDVFGVQNGNGSDGIEVNGATGVTIVGNESRYNAFNGLRVAGVKGSTGTPTLIRSNVFAANRTSGVLVHGSTGTTVGGTGFGNTFGGNLLSGVRVAAAATGTTIEANLIGTDEQGSDLGNAGDGVQITGASGNVVRSNTISFNGTGVRILDTAASTRAAGNRVESNLISENDGDGVAVQGGVNHVIGGIGLGNTIALNGGNGVSVGSSARSPSSAIVVRGNLIGTDSSQAGLGNGGDGVRILGGGGHTVDRNTISDSTGAGVSVGGSSTNTIGSTTVGAGNTIQMNGRGVTVSDFNGVASVTTRGNAIVGNEIAGTLGDGVTVSGAMTVATTIGAGTVNGTLTGLGNTIRDNGGVAIRLANGAQQVSLQANSLYDNVGGATAFASGTNNGRATPSVATAELTYPSRGTPQLAVTGTLASAVIGQQYQIDVYSSRPEDGVPAGGTGTGYGGRTFLGRVTVTATSTNTRSGLLSYSATVSSAGAVLGDYVSVMATNLRPPAGTSSAYSEVAREMTLKGAATASAFASYAK